MSIYLILLSAIYLFELIKYFPYVFKLFRFLVFLALVETLSTFTYEKYFSSIFLNECLQAILLHNVWVFFGIFGFGLGQGVFYFMVD